MEHKNEFDGEVKISSPFMKKLENFWYHYKIHTIAVLFVIFTISILLVQCLGKVEYDSHILYAGPYEIKHTASGGNVAPYVTATSSLKRVSQDTNGDGNITVSLLNLFVINNAEADELVKDNPSLEINSSLVQQDTDTLSQNLLYGDYFVCFLSERLFLEYDERYEGKLFVSLAPYLADGAEVEMLNERAVRLSSLPFYEMPEICNLPSDTVVCLRAKSELAGKVSAKRTERAFAEGEAIITRIFAYGQE